MTIVVVVVVVVGRTTENSIALWGGLLGPQLHIRRTATHAQQDTGGQWGGSSSGGVSCCVLMMMLMICVMVHKVDLIIFCWCFIIAVVVIHWRWWRWDEGGRCCEVLEILFLLSACGPTAQQVGQAFHSGVMTDGWVRSFLLFVALMKFLQGRQNKKLCPDDMEYKNKEIYF